MRKLIKLCYLFYLRPCLNVIKTNYYQLILTIVISVLIFVAGKWSNEHLTSSFQQIQVGFSDKGLLLLTAANIWLAYSLWCGFLVPFRIPQRWKILCQIIPHKAKSIAKFSILETHLDIGKLIFKNIIIFGASCGLNLGIVKTAKVCTAFSIYFLFCNGLRTLLQAIGLKNKRYQQILFGITLVVIIGTNIVYGNIPDFVKLFIPQSLILLIFINIDTLFSSYLMISFVYLIAIFMLIQLTLNKINIEKALQHPSNNILGKKNITCNYLFSKSIRSNVNLSPYHNIFYNLVLHSLACCVLDTKRTRYLIVEVTLVVAFIVGFSIKLDDLIIKILCYLLIGLPSLRFAMSAVQGFRSIFWLVKTSKYSYRKSLLAYGCGAYILGVLVSIPIMLSILVVSTVIFKPHNISFRSTIVSVLWFCSILIPCASLVGLWAQSMLFKGSALKSIIPHIFKPILINIFYFFLVITPCFIGITASQTSGIGYFIIYVFVFAYWYSIFLGNWALNTTNRALTIE